MMSALGLDGGVIKGVTYPPQLRSSSDLDMTLRIYSKVSIELHSSGTGGNILGVVHMLGPIKECEQNCWWNGVLEMTVTIQSVSRVGGRELMSDTYTSAYSIPMTRDSLICVY